MQRHHLEDNETRWASSRLVDGTMRTPVGQSWRLMHVSKRLNLIFGSSAVVAIVVLSVVVIDMLNDWVGDWLSLLWVSGCLAAPYVVGFAIGRFAKHPFGTILGGLLGLVITGIPLMMYLPDGVEGSRPALLWCFVALGITQGALMLPAGGRIRSRSENIQRI